VRCNQLPVHASHFAAVLRAQTNILSERCLAILNSHRVAVARQHKIFGIVKNLMVRTTGSKNRDFEATKHQLLVKLSRAVESEPDRLNSFNDLANASGVSRTTLRHYFENRDGLVAALIHFWAQLGPRREKEQRALQPAKIELGEMLHYLIRGWTSGLGQVFELGLRPSLKHQLLGPVFVSALLEPLFGRFEALLTQLPEFHSMTPLDAREASIELLSPVVMALMHQRSLFGDQCRALDVDSFTDRHLARFLAVWTETKKAKPKKQSKARPQRP
jgi:AcrR family transcriptional regulator